MRWSGHVAPMGEGRGVYMVLVGSPEEKRSLWRPKRRREDNIKMDIREIVIYGADLIRQAEYRVQWRAFVNTVMNLRVRWVLLVETRVDWFSIVSRWRGRLSRSDSHQHLFATTSRHVLDSTQPTIQCVPDSLSTGVKRSWREADHSPPSNA
jgi:hypothetical protein